MNSILPVLIIALACPVGAVAAVYKWIDEDGNTVYSQIPPPKQREHSKVAPPPPPAVDPATAQRQLQEMQQRLEDSREDRELTAEKQDQEQAQRKARETRCAQARNNLRILQQRARQLINDGSGDYRRLSEEEKATKIARYQEVVKKDCAP